MVGVIGSSAGWMPILAAGGILFAGSVTVQAADLGGDCCADLEERIADLEATTVRKGSRNVSLTVYGKVNQAVMFWDDGQEENAYVVTNDASRTRFGFKGKAKISDDWSAYFKIEIGIRTANSKRSNQFDPIGGEKGALDTRHAEWGLESKTWGKFGVGLQKNITKDITKANLAGTGDVGKYSDAEDYGGGFFLVAKGSPASPDGLQWRRLIARTGSAPGEGDRIDSVTYYTPEWHGFKIGAAWGGDDAGAIGALYENKFGTIEVEAGIAYMQNTSNIDTADFHGCPSNDPTIFGNDADCQGVGGSISILDTHSGLYANFGAGQMWDDNIRFNPIFVGTGVDNTYKFWAAETGIQQQWHPLGKTTIFGQYYKYWGGGITQEVEPNADDPINPFVNEASIFSSEVRYWGAGVMQKIDAAEMKLYGLYRNYDFDLTLIDNTTGVVAASNPLENFQVLMTGAVIYF